MSPRLAASAVCAVLLLGALALAEEPLKSGPQVDAQNNRRGFRPQFVAGQGAGANLCPV